MKRTRSFLAGALFLSAFGQVQAVHCLATGKTLAYETPEFTELQFLHAQPEGDYRFTLPPGDYQRHTGPEPGTVDFVLDGVR